MVMMTRRACAVLRLQQLGIKQEMGRPTRKTSPPLRPSSPTVAKQCPGSPGDRKRRASRPVDRRLKMREWLVAMLNAGDLQDQLWWTKKDKEFAVKWIHAARHGFNVTDDTKLTRAWAEHSGVFREGDKEDHKKWKSNFRCALHSLPDVKEVGPSDKRKGEHAVRVYELLEKPIVKQKKEKPSGKARRRFIIKENETLMQIKDGCESDSGASTSTESSDVNATPPHDSSSTECSIPDFSQLGLNTQGMTSNLLQTNHLSGGLVIKKESNSRDGLTAMGGKSIAKEFSFLLASCSSNYPLPDFPIPVPACLSNRTNTSSSISMSTSTRRDSLDALFKLEHGVEDVKIEAEDKDMIPVGIMTTRTRTPSGDSGHPNSPGCTEQENGEVDEILDEPSAPPDDSSSQLKDIKGIFLIHEENGTLTAIDSGDMDWKYMDMLSMQHGSPRVVAVEEVMANNEDFSYTSLHTMEPGL